MYQDFVSLIIATSKACEIWPEKVNAAPLQKQSSVLGCSLTIWSASLCAGRWIKSWFVWLGLSDSRHCFNCEPLICSNEVTLLEEQRSSKSTACLRRACGVGGWRLPRLCRHNSNASTTWCISLAFAMFSSWMNKLKTLNQIKFMKLSYAAVSSFLIKPKMHFKEVSK